MSRVKRSLRPGEVHLKKRRPQRVNASLIDWRFTGTFIKGSKLSWY